MSTDPTRLYVFNQAAESYDLDTYRMNLDEDELAFVRDLFTENGRYVSETSYDSTIVSDVFVTSDENMDAIDEIEAALRDHYPDREIERCQNMSDRAPSSEGLPYVIGIHIEPTQEEREKRKEARKSQRQNNLDRNNNNDFEEKQANQSCPECESKSILTADDGEEICADCGYIIEIDSVS
jgi:hypothetical protein